MAKRSLVAFLVALFCLSSGATATADPGDTTNFDRGPGDAGILALITDDDAFALADLSLVLASPMTLGGSNRTQHYGPFPSQSPDNGTCGDWAQDTFDLHFTVRPNGPNSFTVVAQYKRGDFIVDHFGPSPGSCDTTDGSPPGTVNAGVTGKFHGYLVMTVTGSQENQDPSCIAFAPSASCSRIGFINSHFIGATTIGTFFFHYSAGDQGLVEHEWKNASDDRGGNHGDIRSTDAP